MQVHAAGPARPKNCEEVKAINSTSGVHALYPDNGAPINVYCDQETDNGGWAVFQRRKDGSEDFNRSWTEYEDGFGDLEGEFWLGLSQIYRLTAGGDNDLRVDLTDFDDSEGFALYHGFTLGDAAQNYTLHLEGYAGGTAGDSLIVGDDTGHNNQPFSTAEHYHNQNGTNCAAETHAGWWFNACYWSILNVQWPVEGVGGGD
nr:hypothetical protein BaRGS_033620 [Batillaria attramentaria]